MSDFLQEMVRSSRERVAGARRRMPDTELLRRARDRPPPPPLRDEATFRIIAEVKRRAPSAGPLDGSGAREASEFPRRLARAYGRGGAAAISVLTEPSAFDGSMEDLETVVAAVDLPVMRKDFVVDPYQIVEARAAGAAGALLVLRILDPVRLEEMLSAAAELELFLLLEAFDEADLERASLAVELAAARGGEVLVGLNTRDLCTLEVDPGRLRRLADRFPAGACRVAESGFRTAAEVADAARLGYGAALIGTALVQHPRPQKLLAAMLGAARAAAGAEAHR